MPVAIANVYSTGGRKSIIILKLLIVCVRWCAFLHLKWSAQNSYVTHQSMNYETCCNSVYVPKKRVFFQLKMYSGQNIICTFMYSCHGNWCRTRARSARIELVKQWALVDTINSSFPLSTPHSVYSNKLIHQTTLSRNTYQLHVFIQKYPLYLPIMSNPCWWPIHWL